ncbi:hypothetical protein MMC28_008537 [Mycoblastus sanguinarius]|nr:hypothetical protein [Mycoblastus sanguinarius]
MPNTPFTAGNHLTAKNGRPVVPLIYRANEFEAIGHSIVEYTKKLLSKNDPRGVHLDQGEVNWYFEGDVRATYAEGDERRYWALQQRMCPLIVGFWAMYTNPENFFLHKANEATTHFRELPRDRACRNKGTLILGDGNETVVVPDIGLLSLRHVNYIDVVKAVKGANAEVDFSEMKMLKLWQGIVVNVYHYECDCAKIEKLVEADSEAAKGYWMWVHDSELAMNQQKKSFLAPEFTHRESERVFEENVDQCCRQQPMAASFTFSQQPQQQNGTFHIPSVSESMHQPRADEKRLHDDLLNVQKLSREKMEQRKLVLKEKD